MFIVIGNSYLSWKLRYAWEVAVIHKGWEATYILLEKITKICIIYSYLMGETYSSLNIVWETIRNSLSDNLLG